MQESKNSLASCYANTIWNGDQTLECDAEEMNRFFSPSSLSVFRQLYVQFCGIPGASVDVERLWSSASNLYTKKRNRLHSETVCDELFLKSNSKIQFAPKSTYERLPQNQALLQLNNFNYDSFSAISSFDLTSIQDEHIVNNQNEDIVNNQNEVEDTELGNLDASEIDADDVELRELIESLVEEEEEDFRDDEGSEWWSQSSAPKHFQLALKELQNSQNTVSPCTTLRSRKRQTEEKKSQMPNKKLKYDDFEGWTPSKGDIVLVAFPEDCTCMSADIRSCTCADVWYEGQVISNLIFDPEKKEPGFNVAFDDGDEDHVEFYSGKENKRWKLLS